MFKRIVPVVLGGAMIIGTLAGCSNGGGGATVSHSDEPAAVMGERHLNAASHMVGASLDAAESYQGWTVVRAGIGETLIKLNDKVELEPCIADKWEWVDDYSLKLHIRDGVKFHSGNPVDAEAVKKCFEHVAETNTRFPTYIDLKEIIADGQDLTIVSNSKNPAMLFNLVEPAFSVMDMSVPDIVNAPAGTGPYMVDFFVENRIELVANEDYWGGEVGLDSITFTLIGDSEARVMALQSGEIDMTITIDNSSLKLFENDDYNISLATGLRTNTVKMNNASKFLSNKDLRKALSYAVPREDCSTTITGGEVSTCLFPSSLAFGAKDIKGYNYDLKKAESMLDESGIVDTDGDGWREINGENIYLTYYQTAAHGSSEAGLIAQAVQSSFKEIGVNVEIMSTENLSDVRSSGNFDFYSNNDMTAPTGDCQYYLTYTYQGGNETNYTKYQNAEFDKGLDSLFDEYDVQARYKIAQNLAQILVDDAADLYVTSVPINTVSQSYVKNAKQPTVDYYMITPDITIER